MFVTSTRSMWMPNRRPFLMASSRTLMSTSRRSFSGETAAAATAAETTTTTTTTTTTAKATTSASLPDPPVEAWREVKVYKRRPQYQMPSAAIETPFSHDNHEDQNTNTPWSELEVEPFPSTTAADSAPLAEVLQFVDDGVEFETILATFTHGSSAVKDAIAHRTFARGTYIITSTECGPNLVRMLLENGQVEHEMSVIAALRGQMQNVALSIIGCTSLVHVFRLTEEFTRRPLIKELTANPEKFLALCMSPRTSILIRQLIEHGTDEERAMVAGGMTSKVNELVNDQFAAYVVEFALKYFAPERTDILINEVLQDPYSVIKASTSKHGNWVIRRILKNGTTAQRRAFAASLFGHAQSVLRNPSGSFVMECAFMHIDQESRHSIIQELAVSPRVALDLAVHPSANFCIRKLFTHGTLLQRAIFGRELMGSVHMLATDKRGCFVLEEAIRRTEPAMRSEFFSELLTSPHSVCLLTKHQYGSFITRLIAEYGTVAQVDTLIAALNEEIDVLAGHKHAISTVKKLIEMSNVSQRWKVVTAILSGENAISTLAERRFCATLCSTILQQYKQDKAETTGGANATDVETNNKSSGGSSEREVYEALCEQLEEKILSTKTVKSFTPIERLKSSRLHLRSKEVLPVAQKVEILKTNFMDLATSKDGNVLLQGIVNRDTPTESEVVVALCCKNLLALSRDIWGVFVVLNIINTGAKDQVKAVITALVKIGVDGKRHRTGTELMLLNNNRQGRRVVNAALEAADAEDLAALRKALGMPENDSAQNDANIKHLARKAPRSAAAAVGVNKEAAKPLAWKRQEVRPAVSEEKEPSPVAWQSQRSTPAVAKPVSFASKRREGIPVFREGGGGGSGRL